MLEFERFRIPHDNFCYLFHDGNRGFIVDPGFDPGRVIDFIEGRGLELRWVFLTHHHGDHTASLMKVIERTGAKSVASGYCSDRIGGADLIVEDGDELEMKDSSVKVMETPGHTPGGICLIVDNGYLVSGDTLFIGDCGRCDLPGGSLEKMFASLQRIKELPDDLILLPGHDYGNKMQDTLGNQKKVSGVLLASDLEGFSRL